MCDLMISFNTTTSFPYFSSQVNDRIRSCLVAKILEGYNCSFMQSTRTPKSKDSRMVFSFFSDSCHRLSFRRCFPWRFKIKIVFSGKSKWGPPPTHNCNNCNNK